MWSGKDSSLVMPGGSDGPSPMYTQVRLHCKGSICMVMLFLCRITSTRRLTTLATLQVWNFPLLITVCLCVFNQYKLSFLMDKSPSFAISGPTDFHCERALNSWTDPLNLNAGWLSGLTDLNTEKEHVQDRIAAYMTDLISIGFSGL